MLRNLCFTSKIYATIKTNDRLLSKVEQAKWNTAWYNEVRHGCNCQTCIHANQLTASRLPKDVISISIVV